MADEHCRNAYDMYITYAKMTVIRLYNLPFLVIIIIMRWPQTN